MAETVYEMMAKIGLDHSQVMLGLAAISSRLTGLHSQVGNLKLAFTALGSALVVTELVKGFDAIAKAGGAVNHQLNMMKSIGMTAAETAAAVAQAQQTA